MNIENKNIWLEDAYMEEQFPKLVKHFSGLGWGEEDETQLNSHGFEFFPLGKQSFKYLIIGMCLATS